MGKKKNTTGKRQHDGERKGGRPPRPKRAGKVATAGSKRVAREEGNAQKGDRLNKVIAIAGVASRRKADELIEQGAVRINGKVVKQLGTRVLPSDDITVMGDPIRRGVRKRYILLNKPKDAITTVSDEAGRRTVLDVVGLKEKLFPVGRLDRNTTGVLILTNDGDFAHRMTHPSYEVERTYRARLDKPLSHADAEKIAAGLDIGRGERSEPCFVSIDAKNAFDVEVTLTEGKNREVRRMFEAVGYEVVKLSRRSYAGLTVSGMGRGEWRELTRPELRDLRNRLGMKQFRGI